MFLRQVVLQNGMPFEMKLPVPPLCLGALTEEQVNAELEKGLADFAAGRVHSAAEVRAEFQGALGT
jgi:antitoxin component of RelBE/YafQ-DinJ toxin-antitoxin module